MLTGVALGGMEGEELNLSLLHTPGLWEVVEPFGSANKDVLMEGLPFSPSSHCFDLRLCLTLTLLVLLHIHAYAGQIVVTMPRPHHGGALC